MEHPVSADENLAQTAMHLFSLRNLGEWSLSFHLSNRYI